jgi:hypothetical protein
MPFAVVGRHWIPDNQTIPPEAMNKLHRRDNAPPQVQAINVNTNFSSGDADK